MSKHNYSQYSNKNNKNNKNNSNKLTEAELKPIEAAVEHAVESTPEVEPATVPVVETVPEIPATGTVINCTKLNVRVKPVADADVLCVLEAASTIEIDEARSTSDWYHVITATGVDGYCMRKFVKVNQ